jgi:hypothetical protein
MAQEKPLDMAIVQWNEPEIFPMSLFATFSL